MIFKAWSIRNGCLLAVLFVMGGLVHADTLVTVTMDTSQLVGHPAGPFYLAFQLTDGSGAGNSSTMAVLSNFQFGGGASSGSPTLMGGASGDINSSVTLSDSSFLNFFSQQFTPGSTLTFTLSLTGSVEAGSTPDHFAFSILDQAFKAMPTKGGLFFDVFLAIDLDSPNPTLQTFASDPQRLPVAGGTAVATGQPQVVAIDGIPPTSTVGLSPLPNTNGWNNSDVTVNFSAIDNSGGSGVRQLNISATGAQPIASTIIAASSAFATVFTEGITNFSFFATDLASNVEPAHTLTVKLDKTPPSITGARIPVANLNGWNNTNVAVSFACSDALSGLASDSPPASTVLTSEGANQQVTGTCQDLAGNVASATAGGINIDKTPPALSGLPAANCILWPPNHNFVTVTTISAADLLSGMSSFSVTGTSSEPMDPNNPDIIITGSGLGPRTVQLRADRLGTANGRIYTITSTATDAAGNVVNVDSTCAVPHDQAP
ncbi:MAG: NF038129 family PEP-CTERM protein [Acidobacteriia bacterium]|nr:NF038129 family PEP-CTERM protein [Terriglobia bacterium]